jgi:hypothetical protein
MFSNNDYYYCFSTNLHKFLKFDKGIKFICTGLHPTTYKQFWLYHRNDILADALTEYTKNSTDIGKY